MATLVVHPAYWNRKHGRKLVEWSKRLSRVDRTPQGVSAVEMGARLYLKLGYSHVARLEEEGDTGDRRGVQTELLVFDPKKESLFQRYYSWTQHGASLDYSDK